MLVLNGQSNSNVVEFSPFFGDWICRTGCPLYAFLENGNYGFLNTELLRESVIKLPFYIKWLLELTHFFDKVTKLLRKSPENNLQ